MSDDADEILNSLSGPADEPSKFPELKPKIEIENNKVESNNIKEDKTMEENQNITERLNTLIENLKEKRNQNNLYISTVQYYINVLRNKIFELNKSLLEQQKNNDNNNKNIEEQLQKIKDLEDIINTFETDVGGITQLTTQNENEAKENITNFGERLGEEKNKIDNDIALKPLLPATTGGSRKYKRRKSQKKHKKRKTKKRQH